MSFNNQNSLYYLKIIMGILNFIILSFLFAVICFTTHYVIENYSSKSFLENVTYLPEEPTRILVIVFAAFFLLVYMIELRQKIPVDSRLSQFICFIEIFLCLIIMRFEYMSYNGILLLVIADIASSIRDKHNQGLFLFIMSFIYIISDYDIISMSFKMISFREFLSIYNTNERMILTGIQNALISLNIIVFIMYMIILMRNQMQERKRIASLNLQLQTANEKLQEMNEQLKDYAQMQKKLGEVGERNRIAREIHDTLGHTMTGLSVGLDACITLIDYSVEETKKQLQVLSDVARRGIQDIRRSVNKLRPDALEKQSLEEALRKLFTETMLMSDVYIQYRSTIPQLQFNTDEEDTIFRVIQEGITNAIRHGKATKIFVDIHKQEKWLIINIKDNGIGCEEVHTGFGLIHMKERIQMLHGEMTYNGSHGFCIVAKIPIRWGEDYD